MQTKKKKKREEKRRAYVLNQAEKENSYGSSRLHIRLATADDGSFRRQAD